MSDNPNVNRGKLVYVKARKTRPHQGGHWSEKKKYEAVVLFNAGMGLSQISVELNVPRETIKKWRISPWWEDISKDLRSEETQKLDAKLTKILDKSLESILDRLEEGEFIYDQKTGKIKRTPVKMRDATVAFNTIMDKRQLIRKEPTKITEQTNTATQLANLAEQFAAFVSGKPVVAKDAELVTEYIEGETLVDNGDGTYSHKEDSDAVHDQWETGLQEGTELGAYEEEESCEGQSPTKCSEGDGG